MNISRCQSKDITICAVDCLYPSLAARALEISKSACGNAKSILFSDRKVVGDFDFVEVKKIASIEDYNNFILRELDRFIETDFALIVQWDGYVAHEKAWREDFFDYDYIGAVWPQFSDGMTVGNGGFSLRSKKLLRATATDPAFIDVRDVEDIVIGRTNRALLESKYNLRFAPETVARSFSYEQEKPAGETFGFHGLGNIWRHEPSEVILDIVKQIRPSYYENYQMHSLLMNCYLNRRYGLFAYLYAHTTDRIGSDLLAATLTTALKFVERDVKNMIFWGNLVCKLRRLFGFFTKNNQLV